MKDELASNITNSSEKAFALYEDLLHIKSLYSKTKITGPELRHLSSILRRILVDPDLPSIAGPRIGRVHLLIPDNKDLRKMIDTSECLFASLGTLKFGHLHISDIVLAETNATPSSHNPDNTVPVNLDSFLNQHVLCLENKWARRRDIVKYCANIASGVHSSKPVEKELLLIDSLRKNVRINAEGDCVTLDIGLAPMGYGSDLTFDRRAIDIASMQLMSTAQYVCASPDIDRLLHVIEAELGTRSI